jgi:hypothetical protein
MSEFNKGRDKIITKIVQNNDDMVALQEGNIENLHLT